ncbi:histidine phosphatase family protein [Blastococcus sp. CT_GayMR20]|uniref:histidine phosphatase family protein n=1 Tax=Blastococcus sp. CT_GayMR20 TaxID=2559609 RepID=UPI001ADDD150|nr:histidine phosphatase family protein [Blastococcus sp. CT_GayMR20]
MAARLYLVRHAEAVGQEDIDPGLSDRGRAQAQALGGRLASVRPAGILPGPRRRAAETARIGSGSGTGWTASRSTSATRRASTHPTWRWLRLASANASLTILRWDGGEPGALVSFDDTGHLA